MSDRMKFGIVLGWLLVTVLIGFFVMPIAAAVPLVLGMLLLHRDGPNRSIRIGLPKWGRHQ